MHSYLVLLVLEVLHDPVCFYLILPDSSEFLDPIRKQLRHHRVLREKINHCHI